MFEILVYLFENYYDFDARPAPDTLARKLSAAGFSEDEISEAFDWLSGLKSEISSADTALHCSRRSLRIYTDEEQYKLGSEGIGFLAFFESAGVVSPAIRELIVDRALALNDDQVPLSRLKVIVLMALWSRDKELDTLIVEELLSESGDELAH
jgi:Smg protein